MAFNIPTNYQQIYYPQPAPQMPQQQHGELNPIYTTHYIKKGGVPKMVRLFI